MILTFTEILGRVRDICKDRVQAHTRNTLSLDEVCLGKREFLVMQPVSTSPLWKMLPSSFTVPPFFHMWTVDISCWGPCLRHRVGCRGRGSPSALPGQEAQLSPTAALPPSPRDATVGRLDVVTQRARPLNCKINMKQWSSMVRRQLWYSQLIIMVSMACEESEKCSSVCIILPTEEALLVHR